MSKRRYLFVATLCLMVFGAQSLHAECAKCKLMAAWGLASQPETLFNPDAISRYEGQVVSVQEVKADDGVVEGTYVLLKTPDGNMAVRLGPTWYLERQGFTVEPRQNIEVLASKVVTEADHAALVATKVKNGDRTISLRSPTGVVVWGKADAKKR